MIQKHLQACLRCQKYHILHGDICSIFWSLHDFGVSLTPLSRGATPEAEPVFSVHEVRVQKDLAILMRLLSENDQRADRLQRICHRLAWNYKCDVSHVMTEAGQTLKGWVKAREMYQPWYPLSGSEITFTDLPQFKMWSFNSISTQVFSLST